MKRELVIGRVRTAHGVRGELKIEPISGESAHFTTLNELTLVRRSERHTLRVESVRPAHRVVLVKLAGVDSPEEAKRWRGWEIVVPREQAAPLDEGEYYYADLVGLRVIFENDESGLMTLGTVSAVWEGGPSAILGIRRPDGQERLVPFQEAFVKRVDAEAGTLELETDEVME